VLCYAAFLPSSAFHNSIRHTLFQREQPRGIYFRLSALALPRQFDAIAAAASSLNDASFVRFISKGSLSGALTQRPVNRTLNVVASRTGWLSSRDRNRRFLLTSHEMI
jgi:hypothetical protein